MPVLCRGHRVVDTCIFEEHTSRARDVVLVSVVADSLGLVDVVLVVGGELPDECMVLDSVDWADFEVSEVVEVVLISAFSGAGFAAGVGAGWEEDAGGGAARMGIAWSASK